MVMARTRGQTPKKDWRIVFLNELAQTGSVVTAAKKAGRARATVYEYRHAEPDFAAAWDEAVKVADELMEAEARRRAVEGTLKPVFHRGEIVGKVREYSDTLLIFLLKAHNPAKYRDNPRITVGGEPGNPVKHEHEHTLTITEQIEADLADAFAKVAERAGADCLPADGAGEPVDP